MFFWYFLSINNRPFLAKHGQSERMIEFVGKTWKVELFLYNDRVVGGCQRSLKGLETFLWKSGANTIRTFYLLK